MKISIGDKVKASKEYGGKSGVVTDIRGSFVTVEYSNGDSDSYHESDLTIKNKKMENGGVIGQEIVFDDNGEENTGVIKDIHENTGNYIVLSDDGRTLLADKELDVISLGEMRKAPEKKRFSFFEDGGEVSFSSKAVEKASLEELFDMAKELKMENFHNMNKEMLRRKILDHFKLNRYRKYEDGGNIEKETNEMLMSQIKEVKHHADELSKVVNKSITIEPWVLAKATRAKTDLSDITHYLDGRKMARGGKLTDAQQNKFNKVMSEWKAGKLHSGSKNGPIVTDQDQALAIAYAEANSMMAFGGMINDDLSEDSIDRMEGLSPTATLDEFIMNTQYIVQSLEEEGFEKDEILSFLAYKMVSTINEAQSSSQTWTQQDQNALEGWISDIQDGYGWITPGYVETSWTSRPGSGTKEWTSDIQRRVYQALIDENILFRENENDPEEKGKKVKDLTTAIWAASEENYATGGKMQTGGGVGKYSSVDDFKSSNRYAAKTKADLEFLDLIGSIANDLGINRITDVKHSTQRTGRTLGVQFDNHLNVFYRSSFKGMSRDTYPAFISIQDETGKIIKREDEEPSDSEYKGGMLTFEFNKKGKDSFKSFMIEKLSKKKMSKGGSMTGWKHKAKK